MKNYKDLGFAKKLNFCILEVMKDDIKDEDNKNNEKQDGAVQSDILGSFNVPQDDSVDSETEITFVNSTEDGEELPIKDKTKKLRSDLKICRKEKGEYLIGWQRAKADYVNIQKELNKIELNTIILTKENMMSSLIPVLDSFDMAFTNKEAWEKVDKEWRTGVEYIHQQFKNSLSDSGITEINSIDIIFDPKIHYSLKMIKTKEKNKDHKIAEIIQIGYKIGDKIIRPAGVNVYEYKKQ